MSEITNPPPNGVAAAPENESGHDSIANPPLADGGGADAALDDHLNPNPSALPGSAGPRAGPGAGSAVENPPPWIAASEPAAPEHEAPPLGPLNPPMPGGSTATKPKTARRRATTAKPKTTKRASPAKKTRK